MGGNGDRRASDTLAPVRVNAPLIRRKQPMPVDTGESQSPESEKLPKLTPLRREFLRLYLSPGSDTFMNATQSYLQNYLTTVPKDYQEACQRGYRVLQAVKPYVKKWLEEEGLDEVSLKSKIIQGMNAVETKFFAHEGVVTDQRQVEALGVQYKYTELAAKVTGMLQESIHIAGVSELANRLVTANARLERMRSGQQE